MKNIINILKENNVSLDETVYVNDSDNVLNFPIVSKGNFSIKNEKVDNSSFYILKQCEANVRKQKLSKEYLYLAESLEKIDIEINKIKETRSADNAVVPLYELRKRKKSIKEKIADLEDEIIRNSYTKVFGLSHPIESVKSVSYQDGICASSFDNICRIIPELSSVSADLVHDMPWFIEDLSKIRDAIDSGRKIAIEGGTCLLYFNELYVTLRLRNGTQRKFDYISLRSQDGLEECDLVEYVELHKKDISGAKLHRIKESITSQEYRAYQYLFEFANALNAKLIITIPDMSYRKRFEGIFNGLSEHVFREIKERFFEEFDRITNICIKWIHWFESRYPDVDVTIFHYENRELCEKFYESRQQFIRPRIVNHLTNLPFAKESVLDYACMPALPYNLFGIKDIIEVNRLEESPSITACKKIYKSNINLSCMLFPYKLTKDGKNSMEYTTNEYKDYIEFPKNFRYEGV